MLTIESMMLFAADANADADSTWWLAALLAALMPLALAAGGGLAWLATWYAGRKKTEREDLVADRNWLLKEMREEITMTNDEVRHVRTELAACHKEHARDREQIVRLESELRQVQAGMQRLETHAGLDLATPAPAVVVAGEDGKINAASPSALVLFRYERESDLIGKAIETLIPPRLRAAHHEALARLMTTGAPPWSERLIRGEALTADGQEVPVVVRVSAWRVAGHWTFSASITKQLGNQPSREAAKQ